MKEKINKFIKHPLFSGTFILTAGNFLANVTNYFFHLITGRLLGPAEYAVLTSLLSILYFLGVILIVLATAIMRQAAKFWAKKEKAKLLWFYQKVFGQISIFSLFFVACFLLLISSIGSFLKIEDKFLIFQMGIIGFLNLIVVPNTAFLQAMLRFFYLSFLTVGGSFLKIILVFVLIFLGITIKKILWVMILAGAAVFVFSFLPLKKLNGRVEQLKENTSFSFFQFWLNSLPIFLAVLGMTSLYTSDLLLVKHFLPAYQAGLYASLSVLGKIIFFLSSPVLVVMSPLIIKRREENGNYKKLFYLTLAFIFLACLGMTIAYFLFPKIILWLLYGKKYLRAAPFLGLFAVFISFYSLANVFTSFYIALENRLIGFFPLSAAFLQVILISFFHQNLGQIILASTGAASALLVSLLLYFNYEKKKR